MSDKITRLESPRRSECERYGHVLDGPFTCAICGWIGLNRRSHELRDTHSD